MNQDFNPTIAGITRFATLVTCTAAPWLVGGVLPWAQHWLSLAATAIAALLCVALLTAARSANARLPTLLVPVALMFGIGALQQIDLNWYVDASLDSEDGPGWLLRNHEFISVYPAETRMILARWSLGLPMLLAGFFLFSSDASLRWLWGALAVNGAALAFFGLVQKLTWNGKLFWRIETPAGGQPSFSSFVNRNQAAGFLNLCMAGAIGLLLMELMKRQNGGNPEQDSASNDFSSQYHSGSGPSDLLIVSIVLTCLVATGVLSSLSRGGMASSVLAAVFVAFLWSKTSRSRSAIAFVALGGAFALVVIGWLGISEQLFARFEGTTTESLAQDARVAIMRDSLPAIADRPLMGSGLGTFHYMFEPYQSFEHEYWFYNADNQYLEFVFESGLVGGIAVCTGLLLFLLLVLAGGNSTSSIPAAAAGLFLLVSQGAQAAFDFGSVRPANLMVIALLVGAISGQISRGLRREGRATSWTLLPGVPTRTGAFAIAFAVAAILVTSSMELGAYRVAREAVLMLPSGSSAFETSDSVDAEETRAAIRALRQAVVQRPDDAEVHRSLGLALSHMYSLSVFESLRGSNAALAASPLRTWGLASTRVLHQRVNALHRQNRTARLQSVEEAIPVQGYLPGALSEFKAATACCPVISQSYFPQAELAFLETPDDPRGLEFIESEMVRSRGNASRQFVAGLLAFQSQSIELAARAWGRSLELSNERTERILSIADAFLSDQQIAEEVLPDAPSVLLNLAEQRYSTELEMRRLIGRRAMRLLEATKPSSRNANWFWLRSRAFVVTGELKEAEVSIQGAIVEEPSNAEYHFQLAVVRRAAGDLDGAIDAITICTALDARSKKYREFETKVTREKVVGKRSEDE